MNNNIKTIQDICKPLKMLGIESFVFLKCFNDGSLLKLTNTPELLEKLNLFNLKTVQNNRIGQQSQLSKIRLTTIHFEDKHKTIVIKKIKATGVEYFCFFPQLSDSENETFVIENIDLLERFSVYFKQKAKNMIRVEGKNLLQHKIIKTERKNTAADEKVRRHFIANTMIERSTENFASHELILRAEKYLNEKKLTKREKDCVLCLIKGQTMKGIGRELNISPRTVEDYLYKAKIKCNCFRRSDLIQQVLMHLN